MFRPFSNFRIQGPLIGAVLACLLSLASLSQAQDSSQAQSQEEKTWTLNFRNSDIQEVIKFVADATGKTMVIDPMVKGNVKVIATEPVNEAELYNLFLSVLKVHGFTAIEVGGVVRVLPEKDARSTPGPVIDQSQHASDSYVTQVIELRNVSAAKVLSLLRPLVPQESHMAASEPNNAIIISATAADIARVRELIGRIDQTAVIRTELFTLEYADADTVVQMLNELQRADSGQGSQSRPGVKLVADRRTNTILVSGPELDLRKIGSLIRNMDRPGPQSGNVRVVYLEYAKAKNLAQVLTNLVRNIDEMGGKGEHSKSATIEADEETNSLLITAEIDQIEALIQVIERLDIRRAQVLVEAIIVEMENIDGRKLGVQWAFNSGGTFGSSANPGAIGVPLGPNFPGDDDTGATPDPDGVLGALMSITGQTLGVGRLSDGTSFLAILNALQEDIGANILSTPNLLTLDNHPASITVGQNVPFLTGSYSSTGSGSTPENPFQTIQRQSVGTSLKVTPHVNEGDAIVLDIEQETSSLTGSTDVDVITNERKINTQILIEQGGIAVLGGLIKDEVQESEQKVPVLGSIPVLGRAFRNTVTRNVKTNMLVFIRATVIRDEAALTGATAEKYRYIRNEQLRLYERGAYLGDDEALPVLPELSYDLRKNGAQTGSQVPAPAGGE